LSPEGERIYQSAARERQLGILHNSSNQQSHRSRLGDHVIIEKEDQGCRPTAGTTVQGMSKSSLRVERHHPDGGCLATKCFQSIV